MLADEVKSSHTNPAYLPPTLGRVQLYRDIDLVAQKGQDFTYQEVVQFYLDLLIPKIEYRVELSCLISGATEFLSFNNQKSPDNIV